MFSFSNKEKISIENKKQESTAQKDAVSCHHIHDILALIATVLKRSQHAEHANQSNDPKDYPCSITTCTFTSNVWVAVTLLNLSPIRVSGSIIIREHDTNITNSIFISKPSRFGKKKTERDSM